MGKWRDSTDSALNFSYAVQGTIVSTCSVATPTVAVALPEVPRIAFKGRGSTTGATAFAIGLHCQDSAKPSIALTDAAATYNASNTLTLSPSSTATGVGVQIVYQGRPLPLGPMTALGSRSGSTSVNFQALYVQTAPNVNPGSVNASAVFNLKYN